AEEEAADDRRNTSTQTGGIIMPGFDRTGPMGAGPMTGGRRGSCSPAADEDAPAYGGYGYGRGLGMRRGFRRGYGPGMARGYGRGYGWYPPPAYPAAAGSEIDMLRAQADQMQNALDAVTRRIAELEKQSPESA
ncbi:MAG: DUF5320 domain-containing protein, partial [Desulfobulbaceae bacterium]|nr:DUF5320 domain-containing protein [Desulfobulbaceae bacterium]